MISWMNAKYRTKEINQETKQNEEYSTQTP